MDPLSITAGIVGFLTLAGKIISTAYSLSVKLDRSSFQLSTLVRETEAVSGMVLGLKARCLSQPQTSPPPHLEEFSERIAKCEETMRESQEQELKNLLDVLGQDKLYFILCLQMEASDNVDTIRQQYLEIQANLGDLSRVQKHADGYLGWLVDRENYRIRAEIIKWFGTPTTDSHRTFSAFRRKGSGSWILKRPEFENWLRADGPSFFWLGGSHGSGKSVITSCVVESVREISSQMFPDKPLGVAFHYCRFSDKSSLSATRLLGSFISQLLNQKIPSPETTALIHRFYDKYQRSSSSPNFEDLRDIFRKVAEPFSRLFLIIDGLGEVSSTEMGDIEDFLQFLPRDTNNSDVKVMVASHNEIDIKSEFRHYHSIFIKPEDVADDIKSFIERRADMMRIPPAEKELIIQELPNAADGMFLWVYYQMEHIQNVRYPITREILSALPKGLDATFEEIFCRMTDDDRGLAIKILCFIMFSTRPLDLEELSEGIIIESTHRNLKDVASKRLRDANSVFAICSNLIRKSHSGKIELSHFSVLQFLSSPEIKNGQQNPYYLAKAKSVPLILKACLQYLNLEDINISGQQAHHADSGDWQPQIEEDVFAQAPYLVYSAMNWCEHASFTSESELEQMWPTSFAPFFGSARSFDRWASICRALADPYAYPHGLRPLHVCASHGLKSLAVVMSSNMEMAHLYTPESYLTSDGRTPLHLAAENKKGDMIALIHRRNYGEAMLEAVDCAGRTALRAAVETGDEYAASELLHLGAQVNAVSPVDERTPLFVAVENSWDALVGRMVKRADPSTVLPDGRTLLHVAARVGSIFSISAFLAQDTFRDLLNEPDVRGWTPLHYAIDKGHFPVVEVLVSRGALIDIEDYRKAWTPVHAAIRHERAQYLEALLSRGRVSLVPAPTVLDLETLREKMSHYDEGTEKRKEYEEKYGQAFACHAETACVTSASLAPSPLALATRMCYFDGVKSLLSSRYGKRGSIVEAIQTATLLIKDKPAETVANKILGLLLDEADAQSIVKALLFIRSTIPTTFSELLRDHLRGGEIRKRVLREAVATRSAETVRMVIELWLPSQKDLLQDVLHKVAYVHHEEGELAYVDILVDAGASASRSSTSWFNPLQTAIRQKNWAVAKYFVKRKLWDPEEMSIPDIINFIFKWVDDSHEQAQNGLELIANLLVPTCTGFNAGNELRCHALATHEDTTLLKWAIIRGASPILPNSYNTTPIQLAASEQRISALQILVDAVVDTVPGEMCRVISYRKSLGPPLGICVAKAGIETLEILIDADRRALIKLGPLERSVAELRNIAYIDALCRAIKETFTLGVMALIDHTDDINAIGSQGLTALHVAVMENREDYMTKFIERGAVTGISTQRDSKSTYRLALERGHVNILHELERLGEEARQEDIIVAAIQGLVDVVDRISRKYPDDWRNQMQALYHARELGNTRLIELLRFKFDKERRYLIDGIPRNVFGDTQLHRAARRGDEMVARQLLERYRQARLGSPRTLGIYADTPRLTCLATATDLGGHTALIVAMKLEKWRVAETIAKYGGGIESALEWALQEEQDEDEDLRRRRVETLEEWIHRYWDF